MGKWFSYRGFHFPVITVFGYVNIKSAELNYDLWHLLVPLPPPPRFGTIMMIIKKNF